MKIQNNQVSTLVSKINTYNKAKEFIDINASYPPYVAHALITLALDLVQENPNMRPSIRQVVKTLRVLSIKAQNDSDFLQPTIQFTFTQSSQTGYNMLDKSIQTENDQDDINQVLQDSLLTFNTKTDLDYDQVIHLIQQL